MILLKCALKKTSKKPAPNRIPLTGDGTKKQDYYIVRLARVGHSFPDLLVLKSGKRGVACREWVEKKDEHGNGQVSRIVIIPWEELRNAGMDVSHYLKGVEFRNDDVKKFLLHELFLFPRIFIVKRWLSQLYYYTRTPVRTSRIELLKRLVKKRNKYLIDSGNSISRDIRGDSIPALLSDIYGDRIFAHPREGEYQAELEMNLESLVATGDVKKVDISYFATGQAVATIEKYEKENRRHTDEKKYNRLMIFLTASLVVVGLLQVPWFRDLLGIGAGK